MYADCHAELHCSADLTEPAVAGQSLHELLVGIPGTDVLERSFTHRAKIAGRPIDRNAGANASARVVQKVCDQAAHLPGGTLDARSSLLSGRVRQAGLGEQVADIAMPDSGPRRSWPSTAKNMSRDAARAGIASPAGSVLANASQSATIASKLC